MPRKETKPARRTRDVDAESGKNRVKPRKQKAPPPPPSSDEESVYTDSDLESEQEMPRKDTSTRKSKGKTSKAPKTVASHGISDDEESGSELASKKAQETGTKIAPHMALLLSMTYHIGISSITRPAISRYIPDCRNYFTIVAVICDLICENTYLAEMFPAFFSLELICYAGYLYFYQILRARDAIGMNQLTKEERRCLRKLESFGKPEAWPVPAPLISFLQSLGTYKSVNKSYSYVLPAFPDFAALGTDNADRGLVKMNNVNGIMRVPAMPALIQALFRFGTGASRYNDTFGWLPVTQAALADADGRRFMGLQASTAASAHFQTLVSSGGWLLPSEGPLTLLNNMNATAKRGIIRRWRIPNFEGRIQSIEDFLVLTDGIDSSWISHLLNMANIVNRFFPGSTNLSMVDPVSNLGHMTEMNYSRGAALAAAADTWAYARGELQAHMYGYDDTEEGRILSRAGIITGTMNRYSAGTWPAEKAEAERVGPFFSDDADAAIGQYERKETFHSEATISFDPLRRAHEQVSTTYDPTGEN